MDPSLKIVCLGILLAGPLLSLPLASSSAMAADLTEQETADGTAALQMYKEGRYEDAAKIFVALSVSHSDRLVFIRNTGACYYYLRRIEPALSSLREYLLRKTDITPEDRSEVQRWVAELEQLRQATTAPSVAIATATPADETAVTTRKAAPALLPTPAQPIVSPSNSQPTEPPGQLTIPRSAVPERELRPGPSHQPEGPSFEPEPRQKRDLLAHEVGGVSTSQQTASDNSAAPWIIGGLGLALLATGGVFTYLSQSKFSDTEARYDSSKESSGKTFAYLSAASYGLGAAGLVTSGIILLARPDRSLSRPMALAPLISPNAVGATIQYAY